MRRGTLLAWLAAALCAGTVGAAEPRRAAVVDPAFGETIYAFYQKQYFDAISRLLVARARGEFRHQGDEAELLLGGLYVQYGIPDAAGDVFASLLPATADDAQVQRIWLALAELNYRRDRFPEALAIIEQRFSRGSAPEQAVLLAVKALMRMGRYTEAVAWIGPEVSSLPESRYLRFNLAVALVGNGDEDGGAAMLEALIGAPAADEEMRALRDRVALALAATRLQQQRAADAMAALAHAQLDGVYSSEALLIYGIAATRNNEVPRAVAALTRLVDRSPHEQAVQEGWVALAQAYEVGGDDRRALKAYRGALKRLDGELEWLKMQQASIDKGDWFAALENRVGDIVLRDDRAGLVDNDVLGLPLHYRQFASNRFVIAFAQYVEVSRLARVAVDWQGRIPVLSYLAQSRHERHARLVREARQLLDDTPVDSMRARHRALQARVDAAVAADDAQAIASPERRRLADMVDSVVQRMARWPQRDWSAQQGKLQLLRGVLAWDIARDAPERAWSLRRAVRDGGRLVDEVETRRAAVLKASGREVVNVEGWQQALQEEQQRLAALADQSMGLRLALRSRLEEDASLTVQLHRQRLVQLAADSYFGIAQIGHGSWRAQRDAARGYSAPADDDPTEAPR